MVKDSILFHSICRWSKI